MCLPDGTGRENERGPFGNVGAYAERLTEVFGRTASGKTKAGLSLDRAKRQATFVDLQEPSEMG